MYTQQNFSGFKIHNIFKAGSLGHGTAVFGDFDVDLVIYSDSKCLYKCFIVFSVRYIKLMEHPWGMMLPPMALTARCSSHQAQFIKDS